MTPQFKTSMDQRMKRRYGIEMIPCSKGHLNTRSATTCWVCGGKVSPDAVRTCQKCKKKCKNVRGLKSHVRKGHGWKWRNYVKKFKLERMYNQWTISILRDATLTRTSFVNVNPRSALSNYAKFIKSHAYAQDSTRSSKSLKTNQREIGGIQRDGGTRDFPRVPTMWDLRWENATLHDNEPKSEVLGLPKDILW